MPLLRLVLKNSQRLFWNVIVPYLINLFHVALRENIFLLVGKKPRSPPFTKKALSLIPTTTACCWLYANILRELVTKWCVENRKVSDTQLGFYPDRSTTQPMFILRHFVHAAKQIKPKGCSHLHTAFINFKKRMTLLTDHTFEII